MPMIPDDIEAGKKSDQTISRLEKVKSFGFAKPLIALLAAIGAGFLVRRLTRSEGKSTKPDREKGS